MKAKEAQARIVPSNQLERIFDTLPDGVIACDREGKILLTNAAALKLFEGAAAPGTSYQQFLQHYEMGDEQQRALSLEPWLTSLIIREAASSPQEETIFLQVPSGREVYVHIYCLAVLDAQKHAVGTAYVFHDITHFYQKALHLQRVHHAVLNLREAIAHIPEHSDLACPEGLFLLSPPVLFVAQQLVDVIGQVLDCQYVSLLALGPPAGHVYYVVGSGFTSEQEHYRREMRGCFLPSEFVDETVLARLAANQEVILPADRLRLPPGLREDFGVGNYLLIPMFLEKQMAGGLLIAKAGFDSGYTPEEIKLVKAVATETVLVLGYLRCLHEQAETRVRELVRQEMDRLINEFLNLASHELKTSLTVIKGNIQLAQRRLATLMRQIAEQPEGVSEKLEQAQQPLASAAQSARLQERMIKELIDDARIQANTLELHMQRWDLIALLREAVAKQQRSAPECTIVLEIMPAQKTVPIIADAERITQVINGYLANALDYSPADQPVTVRLTVEDAVARVSVHDEGPGIPLEEQGRIWDRFYYAKRIADQHELGVRLGLGLYFCRAFIERHHGSVGVQSDPGHGATFWFTLPIEASPTRSLAPARDATTVHLVMEDGPSTRF
jgi:signal transduction histidine kinase